MNFKTLHSKVIAVARSNRPSEAVPYAFEQRVMARLDAAALEDSWSLWGAALWRGAAACVLGAILLSISTLVIANERSAAVEDFETAVFAAAEQLGETW